MGLISNSRIQPSKVAFGSIAEILGSENVEFILKQSPYLAVLLGPTVPIALPVLSRMPLFKPMLDPLETNKPVAAELQLRTALVIVTLLPTIWLTKVVALLFGETSNWARIPNVRKLKKNRYLRRAFNS